MNQHVLEDAIENLGKDVVENHLKRKVNIVSRKSKNTFLEGGTSMNQKPMQNKWCIAFIIAAIVAVAMIVVAIVVGMTPKGPDVELPPAEGPETGIYYYDTAEGEYLLTLNSGNQFTIAGPSLNKSGKYVVTQTGIDLDFVKDEDGTGALKMEDDVLTLQYKDKTMRFLKKVNYTVTFNANGGSEVAAVEVLNGKTVAKPADPVKEGSVFIGWYTDAACTKLYPFGSQVITAATTVYAKWADTVLGQDEYMVSFDLGYETEGYEAMTTVGGKLYNVPVPERAGYTFGGWWISMTQQADQLTFAYDEELVFQANTTLFAVWKATPEGGKLEAPMVEVFADSLQWEAVMGASTYRVRILDAAGNVIYDENQGAATKAFDFASQEPGAYTIEVTALSAVEAKNSEPTVRHYVNKALNRVSLFTVIDGGILLWNNVEDAQKYLVTVDCGNDAHNHTAFDNGKSTTFVFTNCDMQPGGICFTVTAVADGMASSVSDTFVYERHLDAVGQIGYNAETQSFYWDTVANAAKYMITVQANGETYTVDNGSATTLSVKHLSGDITLEVVPVTKGYNSPEAATTTYKKTSLATPDGLHFDGNQISWDAVAGATGYMVKVDNMTFNTDTNSLDISGLNMEWLKHKVYSISVMSVGTESSLYSDPVEVKYLSEIQKVTYSNNTLHWTPVLGARKYEIRINGGPIIEVSGQTSQLIKLTQAGVNVIEVRYVDMGGCDWVTTEVYAYTVIYDSRTVTNGVEKEFLAMGDKMTLPAQLEEAGYDFGGWYTSPDASDGNGAMQKENVFAGTGMLMLYADWTPKTYYVEYVGLQGITNITEGDKQAVVFKTGYMLPIPVNPDADGEFVGWYTGPGASGVALTDSQGNCIVDYSFTHDSKAYPFFDTGVLTYILQSDGTYAVTAGPNIASVVNVRIPEYYKGKPVTAVMDNAFYRVTTMERLEIPATIRNVGGSVVNTSQKLKEIVVYTDTIQQNYEVFYSSHDGALLRHDMGTVFLEVFPAGKTGTYTVPDEVSVIRDKTFSNSRINKLIIGTGVTTIMRNAFYNCPYLDTLEFKAGGTAPLTIDSEAFYMTKAVTTLRLPARLANLDFNMLNIFNLLSTLELEENENGNYISVNNMICNANGDTIVYVPMSISGEFEVPKGVVEIAANAFVNHAGLTKIIIPAYVSKIGASAFEGCINVAEVIVEGNRSGNLEIGTKAFFNCDGVNSVIFRGNGSATADTGVTTIGTSAFEGIAELRSVVFEGGANVVIGERAFAENAMLHTLAYAEGATVQSIGKQAFANCLVLAKATIPSTTTTIGDGAFSGCIGIEEVDFAPNGQRITFGSKAFDGCKNLAKVNLPATIDYFEGDTFTGCPALVNINVDPANPNFVAEEGILYTAGYEELLFYSPVLDGDLSKLNPALKKIGNGVFANNTKITKFHGTQNLIAIGDEAFSGCTALAEVTFDPAITQMTIGASAFYKCSKLSAIALPAGTTAIGESAFESAGLTAFVVPANVAILPKNVLKATKITSINIPANVEVIGDGAFNGCTALATITFEEGTKDLTIGTLENASTAGGVFYNTKIAVLNLPDRAVLIGGYAFHSQKNLTTVTMGEGSRMKDIGQYAFYCSSGSKLATLTLGPNVETISVNAFYRTAIKSLVIPKSVKFIGSNAFYYSSNLTDLTFELGGTEDLTIELQAFGNSGFSSVTLPARLRTAYTITNWGNGTNYAQIKNFHKIFLNCAKLTDIHVEEGGKYFASKDGVVYEVEGDNPYAILLCCPSAKTGDLIIPKEVRKVEAAAFYQTNLNTITFEEYASDDTEHYGKPLLELGGGFSTSSSATSNTDAVFSMVNNKGNLTLIQLPSHLKSLGLNTFYNLHKTGIQVLFNPDAHIESIGVKAFNNCKGVTALALPAVNSISTYAFYSLANLKTFTLGAESKLTSIPGYMLSGCNLLTSFEVPASVTVIETRAFSNNKGLTELTFAPGNKLVQIGDFAFAGTSIASFVMPETVEYAGSAVFQNTTAVKSVTLSKKLVSVLGGQYSMFYMANGLEQIIVPDDCVNFKAVDGVLYDANQTILYCFPAAKDPTGFVLPDGLHEIADDAMHGFKGTSLVLPESMERVSTRAFMSAKLTSLHIPSNMTDIDSYGFAGMPDLVTVTFAENSKLTFMGDYAFYNCPSLTKAILPDNVKTIGTNAFAYCVALQEVSLPAALETLPNSCFSECTALTKVVMQEGLKIIEAYAFAASKDTNPVLAEVAIPASVSSIGGSAFNYQKSLKKVTFGENSNLQILGVSAFAQCASLESIVLPSKLSTMNADPFTLKHELGNQQLMTSWIFQNCTSLKSVDMSACEYLLDIPTMTFAGCTALETLLLPPNLVTIQDFSFGYMIHYMSTTSIRHYEPLSSLREIVIPASVTSIGGFAFNGCENLETVTFEEGSTLTSLGVQHAQGDRPAHGMYIFANTPALKSINIPSTVTTIGYGCFENSGMNSKLHDGITVIADYAFRNCDNLVDPGLSDNLAYVGKEAFFDCDKLEKAELFFGLEYLGNMAFAFCEQLKVGYIPATVSNITNPFAGCTGITEFSMDQDNAAMIMDNGVLYDGAMKTLLYYPASLTNETFEIPKSVREIAVGAFAGANLKSLTIPTHIIAIPNYAFQDAALETITFHNQLLSIGDHAFDGCAKLNNVYLFNSTTTLGNYAFANCTSLTDFVFEDIASLTTYYVIGEHFFDGCTAMTELILPNQMKVSNAEAAKYDNFSSLNATSSIPGYMFANTGLVNVVIPARIKSLRTTGVFYNCKQLESVTFEAKTIEGLYLGKSLFYGCSKLKEIAIPAGLSIQPFYNYETMEDAVFGECTALEKVVFYSQSNGVQIGAYAFYNCTSLKEIQHFMVTYEYDSSYKVIGYKTETPDYISVIKTGAFYGCTSLKSLPLSPTFDPYGKAFAGSGIEILRINLRKSYAYLNSGAIFADAPSLKQVWFDGVKSGCFTADAFTGLTQEVNFYFYNMTYEEVVKMVGNDTWFTNACENAKFFFKGEIPDDVIPPEGVVLPA